MSQEPVRTRHVLDDFADQVRRSLEVPLALVDRRIDAAMATLLPAEAWLWSRQDIRRAILELIVDERAYRALVERAIRDRRQSAMFQASLTDDELLSDSVLDDTIHLHIAELRLRDAIPIAARVVLSNYLPDTQEGAGRSFALDHVEQSMAAPWADLWNLTLSHHGGEEYRSAQLDLLRGFDPMGRAVAKIDGYQPELAADLEDPTRPARRLAETLWLSRLDVEVARILERPVPAESAVVLAHGLNLRTSNQLSFDAELGALMDGTRSVAVVTEAAQRELQAIAENFKNALQSFLFARFWNWAIRAAHSEVMRASRVSNQRKESVEVQVEGGYEVLCVLIGVSPNERNISALSAMLETLDKNIRLDYGTVKTPVVVVKYHRPAPGRSARLVFVFMGPLHPFWLDDLRLEKGDPMARLVPVTPYPERVGRRADAKFHDDLWDALRLLFRSHAQEANRLNCVNIGPKELSALSSQVNRPSEVIEKTILAWVQNGALARHGTRGLHLRLADASAWELIMRAGGTELRGAAGGRASAAKRIAGTSGAKDAKPKRRRKKQPEKGTLTQ
jgi:hypothetical protein